MMNIMSIYWETKLFLIKKAGLNPALNDYLYFIVIVAHPGW
jgi:hypothetical protein